MQVTVENLSAVEKKLEVAVPWDDVKAKLDEAYRMLARGVQLKGFRKGKVPRQMLERLYGKQVEQEVVKELVRESFEKATEEHQLRPVAEPVVDESPITPGEPLRYTARIEVRPVVEPIKYFELELRRREPRVADEEVEHALRHKQDELSQFKRVEGRAEVGASDAVIIHLQGTVGEHPIEHDLMLDLSDPEHEPIPGLARALVGKAIGAEAQPVAFTIPADHPRREFAGREVALQVTVRDVREKLTPALDDDFAKDTGEAETLTELRAKIRQRLLEADRQKAERELRDQALRSLREHNPVEVSPGLVDRQLDVVVERAKFQLQLSGVDVKRLDESRIRDDLRGVATDEVKSSLILEAVAQREHVEVTDADLELRLAELAAAQDRNVAKLKAEYAKEGRLDRIRHLLREEKALDLILGRAKIEDVPVAAAGAAQPGGEG